MNIVEKKQYLVNRIKIFMGDKNAVIGESGGVDSALITFLFAEALGANHLIVRTMPYGEQSTADADSVASVLGIKNYGCINIKPSVDSFGFTQKMSIGNAKARVRMINLYNLAAENNGLVIGTSNKTEMMLGYFTKYGDGGCDVEPIADLFKTDVWEMAKSFQNFPQHIITKAPSAELWDGQTDESEIGMSYSEMDEILKRIETQINQDTNTEKLSKIIKMYIGTMHKRAMPLSFEIPE